MPKMKSNSAAKKRFKITATGKISRRRAFHRHILMGKSAKRRRRLCHDAFVAASDVPNVRYLLNV
ncbi:MAG: 50S ribosomal protein L35 [Bacteroidota bacterium]|nr:50S ribosomal protein L35 [Candidatus Kapabacteria bacterium]MDW8220150.1 50S ribosomal protein L35 [Bacteroidota bacterium]